MSYFGSNYWQLSSDGKINHFGTHINNLFTTSDSPKIRNPTLQIFVFVIEGGQEKIVLLVENIFWTNKKMSSCPPSITKTKISRIGIRIFGGSDVVNKLFSLNLEAEIKI